MSALLLIGIGLVGTAAAVVIGGAPLLERALLYAPDPARRHPSEYGLADVETISLTAPDGARLVVWHGRARPGRPTLLYFHGNAGHLGLRAERISAFMSRGQGVAMLAYRGYSGSTGTPGELRNIADAEFTYDWLREMGIAAEDIVLYGESLGTGVAVQLAARVPCGGIVLDAPYTAIVDVGAQAYPYLPVRALMRDRYETWRHVSATSAPMLVIHGERDTIIPVAMGRRIAALAGDRATLVTFPHAGHSDHYQHGSFEAIQRWLATTRGQ